MTEEQGIQNDAKKGPSAGRVVSLIAQRLFDGAVDGIGERMAIIRRESDLFLGSLLLAVGLLGFNSDKFCDGNSADYLSCTRPSTYYYFSAFDQVLIVAGLLLVLVWFFSRRK
jgi:lipoprotein signal peptidase